MSRKDKIVEALRSATGTNDNLPKQGAAVVFNGPASIVIVEAKKTWGFRRRHDFRRARADKRAEPDIISPPAGVAR